ncbi:MAG: S41 family peptidase [Prevotella sp.]
MDPYIHRQGSLLRTFFLGLPLLLSLIFLTSCIDEDEYEDTQEGNFEALWNIMDEHYCFFQEKGVDWDSVYQVYQPQMNSSMTDEQLLEVLGNMLATLRDGHVNLYAGFDYSRYWGFHENYPSNYSDTLITRYLGTDYRIASGLKYRILDDNIGYVRCASFQNGFGEGNLDDLLLYLAPCNGLIIDVRDNGGGLLTSAEQLAARFVNEKTLVGYMRHKTGKGHNDFSDLREQWLKPSSGLRWQKRVVVITNRAVYSAANEFVKYMRCAPNVVTVGDRTGGGAGLPFSSELPNGWIVRFSACPMYDRNGESTEDGIDPDYNVSLSGVDFYRGEDSLIEAARRLLNQ